MKTENGRKHGTAEPGESFKSTRKSHMSPQYCSVGNPIPAAGVLTRCDEYCEYKAEGPFF